MLRQEQEPPHNQSVCGLWDVRDRVQRIEDAALQGELEWRTMACCVAKPAAMVQSSFACAE